MRRKGNSNQRKGFGRVVFFCVMIVMLCISLFLGFGNIPIPSESVEKLIPNERFP